MTLTLTIISAQQFASGQTPSKTVEHGTLKMGRASDNNWILLDPERVISKWHCVIKGEGGRYVVTDTSANGVFMNADLQPVGKDNERELRDGDRMRIGAFDISVAISGAFSGASADTDAGLGLGYDVTSATGLFTTPDSASPLTSPPSRSGAPAWRQPTRAKSADLDRGPPTDRPFEPPSAARAAESGAMDNPVHRDRRPAAPAAEPVPDIPPDWFRGPAEPPKPASAGSRAAARPTKNIGTSDDEEFPPSAQTQPGDPFADFARKDPFISHAQQPAPAAGRADAPQSSAASERPAELARHVHDEAALLTAFLTGAGLQPSDVHLRDPESALHAAGSMWRISVEGLMEILQSRRAIKSEFRIAATEFSRAKNNPLKFSLGVDETLRLLLEPPVHGYQAPADAFKEAISDIREHQVAVLTGMQEAWKEILHRLDPDALEKRQGVDSVLSALLIPRKARCWDAFRELYLAVAQDADALFRHLFASGYQRSSGRRMED